MCNSLGMDLQRARAWWGEQSSPEGWQAGRETGLGVLAGFQEVGGEGAKPLLETCWIIAHTDLVGSQDIPGPEKSTSSDYGDI